MEIVLDHSNVATCHNERFTLPTCRPRNSDDSQPTTNAALPAHESRSRAGTGRTSGL
jgi:hypothetical protein